ncbi:hypothetical protein BGLA2_300008 [Burkholderia gladioli]|nr:hypothetical protein BGLA2_300008 [Burkholderia gladioli]
MSMRRRRRLPVPCLRDDPVAHRRAGSHVGELRGPPCLSSFTKQPEYPACLKTIKQAV